MSRDDKVVAFILLVTDSSATQQIFQDVKKIDKVKEVHMIYGDYDLIIKVELNNLQEMTAFMMQLRKDFAIKKSSTLITLSEDTSEF
ncbi:MAG: Lrp/AsnC ligand binding domain-containing protein [Candidatus Lokiarchaeota archaeon]|nr:Lrp/AsnC ligand binding domain-containing protein [Candidatus Harpocratesius repetitus]